MRRLHGPWNRLCARPLVRRRGTGKLARKPRANALERVSRRGACEMPRLRREIFGGAATTDSRQLPPDPARNRRRGFGNHQKHEKGLTNDLSGVYPIQSRGCGGVGLRAAGGRIARSPETAPARRCPLGDPRRMPGDFRRVRPRENHHAGQHHGYNRPQVPRPKNADHLPARRETGVHAGRKAVLRNRARIRPRQCRSGSGRAVLHHQL
ncbi:hypothetical protein SDC9_128511 [bioreactor metagenome]|uniref:Uncharacterized protein n=1 Tax=bioreactor metagenome TaxID=1076179 RepID=A0A645CX85_9ZZZZ